MIDDDPYRSSTMYGACPRCKTLMTSEIPIACPAGCGEWMSRDELAASWGEIARGSAEMSWPELPAMCPSCNRAMHAVFRQELRFDRCDTHGVWLDAGERERFLELVRHPAPSRPPPADEHLLKVLVNSSAPGSRRVLLAVRDEPTAVTEVRETRSEHGDDQLVIRVGTAYVVLDPIDGDLKSMFDGLRQRCTFAKFYTR